MLLYYSQTAVRLRLRLATCALPALLLLEAITIVLDEWFCVYGAPKEINSDEDVRVRSDTGWYNPTCSFGSGTLKFPK